MEPPHAAPDMPQPSAKGAARKKRSFFVRSQCLWLTFPLLEDKTPQSVFAKLVDKVSRKTEPNGFVFMAVEHYKEDGKRKFHLHAVIMAAKKKRFQLRSDKYFDKTFGIHGHFRGCPNKIDKSPPWVKVRYCRKENFQYFCHPDSFDPDYYWKAGELKKNTRVAVVAKRLQEDPSRQTLYEIDNDFPDIVLTSLAKLEDYRLFQQDKLLWQRKITFYGVETTTRCALTQAICDWINGNIRKKREIKQPQLWLWGPPSCGKTAMIHILSRALRMYEVVDDNGWFDAYENGYYDFIAMDEFDKDVMSLSVFKKLTAGYPMNLKRRGRRPILKTDNLPVIVTSQKNIQNTFQLPFGDPHLEALQDRFIEVLVAYPLGLVELSKCKELVLYKI